EPIHARPAGPVERALRWQRQNRGRAIVVGVLALLVAIFAIGGPIAAGWYAAIARRAENDRDQALAALAAVRADQRSAPRNDMQPPIERDLKLLQGNWRPAKVDGKLPGGFVLTIKESKIRMSYFVGGGGGMMQVEEIDAPFELRAVGSQGRLVPTKKGTGVSEMIYHVDPDRLIIEVGWCGSNKVSLKGEWKRSPEGEP